MRRPGRRALFVAAMVLAIGALAGGLLGGGAQADARPAESHVRAFGHILALLEDNYAGEFDSTGLLESAMQSMLQTLDPHSNYLDRDTFSEMKDEQRGKFYGLGIQINKPGPDKPLTIIAPIEDTPAHRAGLLAGDVVYRIEGEETSELSLHEAVRRLKGDKGTQVTITIQRPSEGSMFDVTLTRDDVPTSSIRVAHMLRPDTGYVRVSNFTSTTATELDDRLRQLEEQGMTRLLLDLRSNPGGLLEQAVWVAERFIPSGKLVVYTRGRVRGSDQDYLATREAERPDVALVVLVDRHSASASEIVAGAIQDHDRGLVVGERTFGKGLVQRVIPLRNGAAVALTTAKYYTPAGRLIQRDYSDPDDYFLDPRDDESAPLVGPGPAGEEDRREVFYTLGTGREVFGGGGILPDYIVPSERATPLLSRLLRQNLIFDFAVRYAASHPGLKEGFELPDQELDGFRKFLRDRALEFSEENFEADRETIRLQIRAQTSRVKWGEVAESRVLAEGDEQIQRGLGLFEEAANLAAAALKGPARKAELVVPR